MSVTITAAGADTYFKTRLSKGLWDAFNDTQLRERALVSAIEVLTQRLGSDLEDETESESAQYYPDRAAYEQTLWMLMNSSHTANGELTGQKWSGVTKLGASKKAEETQEAPLIGDEAMRWMNWCRNPPIRLNRG